MRAAGRWGRAARCRHRPPTGVACAVRSYVPGGYLRSRQCLGRRVEARTKREQGAVRARCVCVCCCCRLCVRAARACAGTLSSPAAHRADSHDHELGDGARGVSRLFTVAATISETARRRSSVSACDRARARGGCCALADEACPSTRGDIFASANIFLLLCVYFKSYGDIYRGPCAFLTSAVTVDTHTFAWSSARARRPRRRSSRPPRHGRRHGCRARSHLCAGAEGEALLWRKIKHRSLLALST